MWRERRPKSPSNCDRLYDTVPLLFLGGIFFNAHRRQDPTSGEWTPQSRHGPTSRGTMIRRLWARGGFGGKGERLRAQRFPNLYRIAYFDGSAAAVDILPAIVMVIAMSRGHVEVTMVAMSVSLADANADDVADFNSDVFRDDHWFVASAQRAGKCRHR